MGITVVGMGPGDGRYLSEAGRQALAEAGVLAGDERYLEIAARVSACKETIPYSGNTTEFADRVRKAARATQVVIPVSGDPCLYSLGGSLLRYFATEELAFLPGLSSLQVLCAKAGISWNDADLHSLHGGHALARGSLRPRRCQILFLDKSTKAATLTKDLLWVYGPEHRVYLGKKLGFDQEEIRSCTLASLAGETLGDLSILILPGIRPQVFQAGQDLAAVLVSFGTSNKESLELDLGGCETRLRQAFPGIPMMRAFSSERVRGILRDRGYQVANVPEALEHLLKTGYRNIILLPIHVFTGEEFHKVQSQAGAWRDSFASLHVAQPLFGEAEGFDQAIHALNGLLPSCANNEAIVLMGHGSKHPAASVYSMIQHKLEDLGENRYLATVEGYPSLDRVLAILKKKAVEKVFLLPLMIFAGVHVRDDMAGEAAQSWVNRLQSAGIKTEALVRGLGREPAIQEIFVKRFQAALDRLEADKKPQSGRNHHDGN